MRLCVAVFLLLTTLLPRTSRAEGYGSTYGTTPDGRAVFFDEPSTIGVWTDDDWEHRQFISNEPCAFVHELTAIAHPHKDATGALICAASGKSPLAGAIYEVRRLRRSVCEHGDPESRLTCVSGCGRKSLAPRILWTHHYEC